MLHIVALGSQVFIAFGHAGIFVDRTKIRCAEGRDFPAHLGNTLVCGRKAFDFNRLFLGRTGGQFVGIPKFIDDLLFLEFTGSLFLFEAGCFALQLQNGLIFILCLLFGLAAFGLQLRAFVNGFLQHLPGPV